MKDNKKIQGEKGKGIITKGKPAEKNERLTKFSITRSEAENDG